MKALSYHHVILVSKALPMLLVGTITHFEGAGTCPQSPPTVVAPKPFTFTHHYSHQKMSSRWYVLPQIAFFQIKSNTGVDKCCSLIHVSQTYRKRLWWKEKYGFYYWGMERTHHAIGILPNMGRVFPIKKIYNVCPAEEVQSVEKQILW